MLPAIGLAAAGSTIGSGIAASTGQLDPLRIMIALDRAHHNRESASVIGLPSSVISDTVSVIQEKISDFRRKHGSTHHPKSSTDDNDNIKDMSTENFGDGPVGCIRKAKWIMSVDPPLTREVAVKLFRPVIYEGIAISLADVSAIAEFQRIKHPNLVTDRCTELLSTDGPVPALVSKWSDGNAYDLCELLSERNAHGGLAAAAHMDALAQLAAGLKALHASQLISRNVKTSNVLYTRGGGVTVLRHSDYALVPVLCARHDLSALLEVALLDNLACVSPHDIAASAAGQAVGPGYDVYSLAMVAFEVRCCVFVLVRVYVRMHAFVCMSVLVTHFQSVVGPVRVPAVCADACRQRCGSECGAATQHAGARAVAALPGRRSDRQTHRTTDRTRTATTEQMSRHHGCARVRHGNAPRRL